MSLETELAANTAALNANTAALNAVLAAGGTAAPTNVVPITPPVKPATKQAKTKAEPEPEPEPAVEKPTKVAAPAPAEEEFSDPLDKGTVVVVQGTPAPEKLDVDALVNDITQAWKDKLASADAERKNVLKDKFPELRSKWGLADGAKLISLAETPENLVGLLGDIQAL